MTTCFCGVALFVLSGTWPDTPDGLLHLHRVHGLADALRMGVLYPRWFPDFAFGYGYPVFNYYAPGFYYPPAMLNLLGFDLLLAVRITLAASFAISALWMFRLARLYVSWWAAIAAVLCFQFFPYRLYDFFIRGAFPEFMAFMWLPMIAYYTILATTNSMPHNRVYMGKASLAWAGLILTHNLTALMASLVLGLTLLLVVLSQVRNMKANDYIIGVGINTMGIGLLLSEWYALPAMLESHWVEVGHGAVARGYTNHFAYVTDLVDFSMYYIYPSAAHRTVPLPFYTVVLVCVALWMLMFVPSKERRLPMLIVLLITISAVWLTSWYSQGVWDIIPVILGKLQFPWRWYTIASLGFALLVAFGVESLSKFQVLPKHSLPILSMLLSAYFVVYAIAGLTYPVADPAEPDISVASMWAWDAEHGQVGATWTGEFLPIWVEEQRWAIGRPPSNASEPVSISEATTAPTITLLQKNLYQQSLTIDTPNPFKLIFHQFYFPAWRVIVDDVAAETQPATHLGLLSVEIPPGSHTVTVSWSTTTTVWIGSLLTLTGCILLVVLWQPTVSRPFQRRSTLILSGLVITILVVVGASSVIAHSANPDATSLRQGVDFGAMHLVGVETHPVKPGETATVDLTWVVTNPVKEPLTAFVHVLNAEGAVIAQYDSPPGGLYTQHQRWVTGLMLQSTHPIPLPHTLPSGEYQLKAGLYPAINPETPLLPAGTHDPRVDIGLLEVQP
ncbi:MAG: 6-pyruvoyl-tetrahydropterin synthase-related protein [Chloroflexota bacterium]